MSGLNRTHEYEYDTTDKKHKWINSRLICLKGLIRKTYKNNQSNHTYIFLFLIHHMFSKISFLIWMSMN